MSKKKVFDANSNEIFSNDDGDIFEFNHDRVSYISEDIHQHYTKTLEKFSAKFKKAKSADKRQKHALNIVALHDEWNLGDDQQNTETLYCLWSRNNPDIWTDVTTENEYYSQ